MKTLLKVFQITQNLLKQREIRDVVAHVFNSWSTSPSQNTVMKSLLIFLQIAQNLLKRNDNNPSAISQLVTQSGTLG